MERRDPRRLAVWGLLLLGACSWTFQQPTVRVAEVRLATLGLRGGSLVARMLVENPNGYALRSEDFRYQIDFLGAPGEEPEWRTLAAGRVAEPVSVPANDSASVDVEIPFEFASVGAALGSLLRQGELEYRFTGTLRARTRWGGATIPFDERGVLRR